MKREELYNGQIKPVKSITMTGGAYIKTDIICPNGFMIVGKMTAETQPTTFIYSEDQCQTLQNESVDKTISMRSKPYNGSNAYAQFRYIVETGVPFEIEASIIGANYYCKFNGVEKSVSWRTGSKATSFQNFPYCIGTNGQNNISTFFFVKFYDDKDKTTLLGEFLPALQKNIPGMYDTVSGKFYTNASQTGQITYSL